MLIKSLKLLMVMASISLIIISQGNSQEFKLIPKKKLTTESKTIKGVQVGTGWSAKENPNEAVKEAIQMALMGSLDEPPDFAIIFASSGSDMQSILMSSNKLFKGKTKIYGGSSDSRAVMTNKGYIRATKRAYEYAKKEGKRSLALMTVSSKYIVFGVGSADCYAYPTVQHAARSAVLEAIKSAGKTPVEKPQAVLITSPRGLEEEALKGIEEVIGIRIPILGGTAGGPTFASFGKDQVFERGISLAVIYTDLPVGWRFEGGFDAVDSESGVVTKVDGQNILEIDHRPALDVYDEWLGGEIGKLMKEHQNRFDQVRALLNLHPLYRKYAAPDGSEYRLFSHPWPKDKSLVEKAVSTSTKIKVGERIYLSNGTWETLMNRIGNLPKQAKSQAGMSSKSKPIFGIGYICAGVLGTIPESERDKISYLLNYSNNDAPFIASFTWGEQGYFPGVGNKHGNLCTSFFVIGDK